MVRARIVEELPSSLTPRTIYLLQNKENDQFDIYVTDDSGSLRKDRYVRYKAGTDINFRETSEGTFVEWKQPSHLSRESIDLKADKSNTYNKQQVDEMIALVTSREKVYDATFQSGFVGTEGSDPRRRSFSVKNGFGKIHLDFTKNSGPTQATVATLPPNAPTPSTLIEVQVAAGVFVWIDSGSREIVSRGLSLGRRYIVDLIGFFN